MNHNFLIVYFSPFLSHAVATLLIKQIRFQNNVPNDLCLSTHKWQLASSEGLHGHHLCSAFFCGSTLRLNSPGWGYSALRFTQRPLLLLWKYKPGTASVKAMGSHPSLAPCSPVSHQISSGRRTEVLALLLGSGGPNVMSLACPRLLLRKTCWCPPPARTP